MPLIARSIPANCYFASQFQLNLLDNPFEILNEQKQLTDGITSTDDFSENDIILHYELSAVDTADAI